MLLLFEIFYLSYTLSQYQIKGIAYIIDRYQKYLEVFHHKILLGFSLAENIRRIYENSGYIFFYKNNG